MKTLIRPLDTFGFVEREKRADGEYMQNLCGRDFVYYVLNCLFPDDFSPDAISPQVIDEFGLFGKPMPAKLAWTQIQFSNTAEFLATKGLQLNINDQEIKSYLDFVKAILFSRKRLDQALQDIERAIDCDQTCGIDISLGLGGLLDHVMLVYGYDEENLYIIDTHKTPKLEYELVDPSYPFYFKLPKGVIQKRWTTFGRVWKVTHQ